MKRGGTKRNIEEKIEVANRICEIYGEGRFTIESVCADHGVEYSTFVKWCYEFQEIQQIYKKAKENHSKATKERIREKAQTALERALTTYHVDESEVEEMFDKKNRLVGKKVRAKKKAINPNVAAIIFALKNADPSNWSDQLGIDLGGELQIFKVGDQIIKF
jgi:transposase-like protein